MHKDRMPNGQMPPAIESVAMIRVRHRVGLGVQSDPVRFVDSYYRDNQHVFTIDLYASEPNDTSGATDAQ